MLPLVEMPDVELWATGYLRTKLAARSESYAADVFVANYVPTTRVDRMVQVRRDGGPRVDLVHTAARLAVNVWATNDSEVSDLARLVEALLLAVRATDPVEAVTSLSGPSPIPDAQPRLFFTVEVLIRGEVA